VKSALKKILAKLADHSAGAKTWAGSGEEYRDRDVIGVSQARKGQCHVLTKPSGPLQHDEGVTRRELKWSWQADWAGEQGLSAKSRRAAGSQQTASTMACCRAGLIRPLSRRSQATSGLLGRCGAASLHGMLKDEMPLPAILEGMGMTTGATGGTGGAARVGALAERSSARRCGATVAGETQRLRLAGCCTTCRDVLVCCCGAHTIPAARAATACGALRHASEGCTDPT
jgi:hypothetical protein